MAGPQIAVIVLTIATVWMSSSNSEELEPSILKKPGDHFAFTNDLDGIEHTSAKDLDAAKTSLLTRRQRQNSDIPGVYYLKKLYKLLKDYPNLTKNKKKWIKPRDSTSRPEYAHNLGGLDEYDSVELLSAIDQRLKKRAEKKRKSPRQEWKIAKSPRLAKQGKKRWRPTLPSLEYDY